MYPEYLHQYIPPDFDLAKYDKAANMEFINWIENLEQRFEPFMHYLTGDTTCNELKKKDANKYDKNLYAFINEGVNQKELVQKKISNNISCGVVLDSLFHSFFKTSFIDDGTEYASIVKGITYAELVLLRDAYITEEVQELYSKAEPSFFSSVWEKNLGKLNDVIHSHGSDGEVNLSWLKVDMNCSDSEITSAFSTWLKKTRTKQEAEDKPKRREFKLKNFNQVAFRKWHDSKVLPYIDLVTWNFLQENKVTSRILGDILFPDPRNLSDTTAIINDTVKPLAIKLTSKVTLKRMMAALAYKTRNKIT